MKQKGLAPILIVILIALALGGYLVYQRQTKPSPTQPLPTPTAASPASTGAAETTDWKTYANSHINLTFRYPPSWNIQELKDNDTVNGVEINGPEGMVHAAWGSGFGGGCDAVNHISFQIFETSQDICHGIVDGSENWSQIYKKLSPTVTFGMYAKANSPYQTNRNMVLKVLSTFKFSNEEVDHCGSAVGQCKTGYRCIPDPNPPITSPTGDVPGICVKN